MPGQSGVDLARDLSRMRPEIPVIVCTGHGAGLTREKGRELGFFEVLLKPVEFEELSGAIRSALDASASRQP